VCAATLGAENLNPGEKTTSCQVLVIGGGVVGLAVARAAALARRACVVLEAAPRIGTGVSSRSSEVVHAGIYYARNSLKAKLCVQGRQLLYAYCAENGIDVMRRGKLLVATSPGQVAQLELVKQAAESNGVCDLVDLSRRDALALEPKLECHGALLSPSTGVLDVHAFLLTLQQQVTSLGGIVAVDSIVQSVSLTAQGKFEVSVRCASGADAFTVTCDQVVNCAGLAAPDVARTIRTGNPKHDRHVPGVAYYAKGSYFKLLRPSPFEHLIYPLPEAHGLGIHLTVDVAGNARFGPDVEWVAKPSYDVDPARAQAFARVVQTYFPSLPDETALAPDYAGVRPKLGPESEPARDFVIWGPSEHAVPGLVHCLGIESPGITSSLAIGQFVADALRWRS
jgi:L-2-hydroxyglutarate oxidase LhgO